MTRLVASARPTKSGVSVRFGRCGKNKNQRGTPVSKSRRQEVYARDGHRCLLCGSPDDLTVDHDVPRTKGGTNDVENLRTLCKPCNSLKGDRLVQTWSAGR